MTAYPQFTNQDAMAADPQSQTSINSDNSMAANPQLSNWDAMAADPQSQTLINSGNSAMANVRPLELASTNRDAMAATPQSQSLKKSGDSETANNRPFDSQFAGKFFFAPNSESPAPTSESVAVTHNNQTPQVPGESEKAKVPTAANPKNLIKTPTDMNVATDNSIEKELGASHRRRSPKQQQFRVINSNIRCEEGQPAAANLSPSPPARNLRLLRRLRPPGNAEKGKDETTSFRSRVDGPINVAMRVENLSPNPTLQ